MTAQPTDADRATAHALVNDWDLAEEDGYDRLADRIAQALAEARQPFLDLADRLEHQSPGLELPRGHVADMIRAVARNAP